MLLLLILVHVYTYCTMAFCIFFWGLKGRPFTMRDKAYIET